MKATLAGLVLFLGVLRGPSPCFAQEVKKEDFPGVVNYSRVEATVACGGATDPAKAFPELKRQGFRAVVNLRTAGEPNVDIEGAVSAAQAAGLTYLHIPLNGSSPDPAVADRFLEAVSRPEHQPVYIHCGSANRVGALWLIKRAVADCWSVEKAAAEAEAIGLRSEALRKFALDYVASRRPARGCP